MSDRQTKVTLTAQVSNYINGFEQAHAATNKAKGAAEDATAVYERQNQAMTEVGGVLVATGAAALAATGLAVKAAIDWESAWAGVQKTVDGTPEQMEQIEEGLRGLSRELPTSAIEIAEVAAAAGQLGIKAENVVSFTRTMVDLGETTNLSANEAATSLARFMNVMGTSQDKVSNLGSSVVELGNNYATTEAEIVSMAQRLSGAGRQVGLTEGQTLGLATALSSVGIEAEAGGSAISKVMINIASEVETGGDKLALFASTAGQSAEEFSEQWRTAPGEALAAFVAGLANTESQGKSTFAVLEELGITEVRMRDALLRSSAAADMFNEAMVTGNEAFDENAALAKEAAVRYGTVASQIEIAKNQVIDAAISFGQVFLPAVSAAAEAVGVISGGLAAMPPSAQAVVAVLIALAGATALTGGAFLLAVPKIAQYQLALATLASSQIPAVAAAATTLQKTTAASTAGLSRMAAFMTGPFGVGLAAAGVGVKLLTDYLDSLKASTEDYQNVIATGSSASELFEVADQGRVYSALDKATESAEAFQGALNKLSTSDFLTGLDLSAQQLRKSLGDLGDELAVTATTDLPAAQRAFSTIASEMELSDDQMLQLLDSMPAYKDALKAQATQLGQTASDHNLLQLAQKQTESSSKTASDAYIEEADAAAELGDQLTDLIDTINEFNGVNQDAVSTNAAYQEALAGIGDEVQRQKDAYEEANDTLSGFSLSLDENTASGAGNASMLSDVAARAQEAAQAQFEVDQVTMDAKDAADKYAGTLADQRAKFEQSAAAAGFNADEVKKLADRVFGLPSAREVKVLAETATAQRSLDAFITRNDGRVISVRQQLITEAVSSGAARGEANAAYRADGAVVDYYAAGGVRENHVAQIAPAGAWRVWAEPETEGEAYIPFAASKRDRSLAIWEETGRRLNAFADGGLWDASRYQAAPPAPRTLVVRDSSQGAAPLTQNIYAAPGVSASEVARIAADERNFVMRGNK